MQVSNNSDPIKVTKTIVTKNVQDDDGSWIFKVYEKFDPSHYPDNGPPRTGMCLNFYGKTAKEARDSARKFIRSVSEALLKSV
jgi:hypothetical protein